MRKITEANLKTTFAVKASDKCPICGLTKEKYQEF